MRRRILRGEDEGGAQLTLLLAMVGVLFLVLLVVRVAHANDMRSKAQTGADAAALGALAPLRDEAIRLARSGTDPAGIGFWAADGSAAKSREYAWRNGTTLVGQPLVSGVLGHTAKATVVTQDCQPLERGEKSSESVRCADENGRDGKGRRGAAAAIARLTLPGCMYEARPRKHKDENQIDPTALVCGGVTVWRSDVGPTNYSAVSPLFKVRLVEREDDCSFGGSAAQPAAGGDASDIPADYLKIYRDAGKRSGIPWTLLAGVGKIETDHGRSNLPGVHGGENYAGAGGPMQFLAPTWSSYGVDGNNDGKKNRYDPADAIPGAANYLKASGAPQNERKALWAYNHSTKYADDVLSWARRYGGGGFGVSPATPVAVECGDSGGFVGADVKIPPGIAGRIIAFARAQLGKPYVWGAAGPNSFDCSGLVMQAYRAAGIAIPRVTTPQWNQTPHIPNGTEQPGDLIFLHYGGSIYPGHVALVIGNGQMIEAPRPGKNVQLSSYKGNSHIVGFTRPLTRSAAA
ncbi:NlpC/P60 family protein [Actinomadura xylanilytica]|uniref:C40 family peptidase n=1 Tax=Actinomadura xylanilytica TaxID=887459 RepID=UPI00255A8997|nr:NlpC/P60 family protein [Actinomadura xylanilytica]MDL4772208.1 NlpC/P60 family protein [Actinomadura xylanilytica]